MQATTVPPAGTSGQPHLKRVLSLWDLVYYGIILTSPIAAVPLFGEAQFLSRGHAVTTLLLGMVAMSVTAISFGRMANVYPASGSVYSYISRVLNPHVGFILGWAMFLEYLFQPIQNALYAVLTIQPPGAAGSICGAFRSDCGIHYGHGHARNQIQRTHQRNLAGIHDAGHNRISCSGIPLHRASSNVHRTFFGAADLQSRNF